MPEALSNALETLAKLSESDRRAVLQRLTPDERALIAQLKTPSRAPAGARSELKPKLTLPPCSGWLARRLTAVADGRESREVTVLARDAVRAMLIANETPP